MNRQPQLHALADVGLDKQVRLGPSKGFDASKASDDVRLMSIGHWQPDGAYGCDLRCPLNVDSCRPLSLRPAGTELPRRLSAIGVQMQRAIDRRMPRRRHPKFVPEHVHASR